MDALWLLANFDWIVVGAGAAYIAWLFYRRGAEQRRQRRDPR